MFFFIYSVLADRAIKSLLAKDIAIVPMRYPEYALAEDLETFSKTPFGAFKDTPRYSRRATIFSNDKYYNIRINGKMLCSKSDNIVECNEPTLFEIKPYKAGYIISDRDNFCITATPRLKMEQCYSKEKYQTFLMSDQTLRYCDEDLAIQEPVPEKSKDPAKSQSLPSPRRRKKDPKKMLDDVIKKHNPSKKMEKTLKKLWGWKWGKFPKLKFC